MIKNEKTRTFIILQVAVLIYSIVSVLSKIASIQLKIYGLFSWQCIGVITLMILTLGVYALVWQKSLKKMKLSVAYANKGITLLWSIVWSVIIFGETLKATNLIGIGFILCGIIMVNKDE